MTQPPKEEVLEWINSWLQEGGAEQESTPLLSTEEHQKIKAVHEALGRATSGQQSRTPLRHLPGHLLPLIY